MKKTVVLALLAVILLSIVGIGVSRAYFSDQAKVEGNSVTTGTWDGD
jgi:predicted ribosomally synthesized peptide with SipW-like signal peptide